MKRSKVPTPYILIKASTNSKWDGVAFAIIHLTDDWKTRMTARLEAISQFKADRGFCTHVYWDEPLGYYVEMMPVSLFDKILHRDEDYTFITLEFGEERTFDKPYNKLEVHQMCITKSGIAHYKAYGRHTREEFRTEEFNLGKLVQVI